MAQWSRFAGKRQEATAGKAFCPSAGGGYRLSARQPGARKERGRFPRSVVGAAALRICGKEPRTGWKEHRSLSPERKGDPDPARSRAGMASVQGDMKSSCARAFPSMPQCDWRGYSVPVANSGVSAAHWSHRPVNSISTPNTVKPSAWTFPQGGGATETDTSPTRPQTVHRTC